MRALTGKRGVDIVFEHIGSETFERSLKALSRGGRLVTCGSTSGGEATINIRLIFFKLLSILGSTMGSVAELQEIMRHIEAGRLRPVIDRVLPMDQIAEGHRVLSLEPLNSVLTLNDVTGAKFDQESVAALKSMVAANAPYVKRGAVIGISGLHAPWSVKRAVLTLLAASIGIAIVAELLVGSAESMAHTLGWNSVFVGVILLAIIGNAAEHSTALVLARRNDMDTAMTITYQSSLQIALFVTPLLVPLCGGSNLLIVVRPRSSHVGLPATAVGVTLAASVGTCATPNSRMEAAPASANRPRSVDPR